MEPDPRRTAPALPRRRREPVLRRVRRCADRDEERPGPRVAERGVQRPAPAGAAAPVQGVLRVLRQARPVPAVQVPQRPAVRHQRRALLHQYKAFSAFFAKRARYPRFKSRNVRQSATYTRSAFRMKAGALWLAKTTAPLAFVWSWPDVDVTGLDPTTVTVSRDPCGRWYVSFAVEVADPEQLPATGTVVGVDLGIKDFAVTSDGEKIPSPRHLARREHNLARYQRRMASCQKGAAKPPKAKAKVARAHRKVRASRADFLHRASTRLVRDHDVIAIEDLAVRNMVRNHSLAKAISDCGWGEFRRMIEYKAAKAGRRVIPVDRWYPSSKTCSSCGYLLA